MKVKCMIDKTKYTNKPQGKAIGTIQNNLKEIDIEIRKLAELLVAGCSFKPAFLMGKSDDDWVSQQLIALDFDKDTTINEELNKCEKLNILPSFGYTSFNHTEGQHKFRLVFTLNKIIADTSKMKNIMHIFKHLFNKTDDQTFNLGRLFFGGKELVYMDYDNRVDVERLLSEYSDLIENGVREFFDYDNKNIYNSNYVSRKTQKTINSYNVNYNIQAIKDKNIKYLQSVLQIDNGVVLHNEQEFYDYITTQVNLPKLLGIGDFSSFKCIIHEDNNPSANIFKGVNDVWMYKCFSSDCGFVGNIIHVIQAITRLKTHKVIEFIKEIYQIQINKTDWQEEQIAILETNKQMIINGSFELCYPEVYKLIRRYIPQLIMMHDIAIMNVRDENYTDENGDIVFFISNSELSRLMASNSNKRINQRNVLFAFLNLLKKLDKNEIPKDDLEKALEIKKKYKHHNIVNYYAIGDYDVFKMFGSEKRAKMWSANNMSMTGLSYEGLYRTFGKAIADEAYPQLKTKFIKTEKGFKEVDRTTTKASDDRTVEISLNIMEMISANGYAAEKDVVEMLKSTYGKAFTQTQLKRSLQEILDTYNLIRVRANKQIKEQYDMDTKGYPFIIVKNGDLHE